MSMTTWLGPAVVAVTVWGAPPPQTDDAWSTFGAAFPLFPCQDGWMACIVRGDAVDSELRSDPTGQRVRADLRLGWFDLAPTDAFSPFVGLSAYPPDPPAPAPDRAHEVEGVTGARHGHAEPHAEPHSEPHSEPRAAAPAQPQPPAPGCGDDRALERLALLGELDPATTACLDARATDPGLKMTERKRASRLLLADAWDRGAVERWDGLTRRHLDELDASDPDLCYKYAAWLARQGPARAQGAERWAGEALKNRHVWVGDDYTNRVYSLYKIRAAAAQTVWQEADRAYLAAPTPEARPGLDALRDATKVAAREWLDFARSSGRDATTPLALCRQAAGTSAYCD